MSKINFNNELIYGDNDKYIKTKIKLYGENTIFQGKKIPKEKAPWDIHKIYLYAKDPCEAKYQFLINKRESTGLKHFNGPKAFLEYSNDIQNVYKNIEKYNPGKKGKILIVFDYMIADMNNNKKLNSIKTELFIRDRKLNISLVFIIQSYFKVPKDVRLNSTHFFIMKIPNEGELQQIELNHSSDIDFKDFIKFYKNVLQNHILF